MRLRNLSLKPVYNSERDNLLKDFYIPALSCSISYKRAVGFFSASTLSYAAQGLTCFVKNDGKMQLIVGAELAPDEHQAALRGYADRELIANVLGGELKTVILEVNEKLFLKRLEALQWLITHKRLDIKLAVRPRGMYHEKIGVLEDSSGDFVVFQGSANESLRALSPYFNYESINVFRSWKDGDREYFEAHLESFDTLWNGRSPSTIVLDLPAAAQSALRNRTFPPDIEEWPDELSFDTGSPGSTSPGLVVPRGIEPFNHQRAALFEWKKGNWKGILDLATGAGKTFTALYGASKIFDSMQRLFLLIAVPYQVLGEQWSDELRAFGVMPIFCSSQNPSWETELGRSVDLFRTGRVNLAAAVVLNATLAQPRFQDIIRRIKDSESFMFVGDECHHHGTSRYAAALPENANLRMGLSATYERFGDIEGTERIENYYGNVVYTFSLAQAIDQGFLVPYKYHLELVELNSSEEDTYCEISEKIRERFQVLQGTSFDEAFEDPLIKTLLLRRSRLLGLLTSKRVRFAELVDRNKLTDRTLVYCGVGAIPDPEADNDVLGEELQSIDLVTRTISEKGYRVARFTSQESADEKVRIMEAFRNGSIQVLTAIRCLDEGLNVPSCDTAYILASSQNPRQFVQRRGRILRRSRDKHSATLWDFLPLPPKSISAAHEKKLLAREIARISEFSKHSQNFRETYDKLYPLLQKYDLGADFLLA